VVLCGPQVFGASDESVTLKHGVSPGFLLIGHNSIRNTSCEASECCALGRRAPIRRAPSLTRVGETGERHVPA